MQKTRIYNRVFHGDWVKCNDCGAIMLLPCGADQCPECTSENLSWQDTNKQETDVEQLGENVIKTGKTLKPSDYLTPETLEQEFPEYYKEATGKVMGHTDFFNIVRKIKQMEYSELYAAIKAHGGSYEFDLYDDDHYPIIAVNVDCICPNPTDVCVRKVYIDKNNILQLEGEEKEYGEKIDFQWSDVFAGHLSSIIDYLPCARDVSSVKQHHITNVLFGHDAINAYQNGTWEHFANSGEGYSHIVRTFQTDAEKQAYLAGLSDQSGWDDYLELVENELDDDFNIETYE